MEDNLEQAELQARIQSQNLREIEVRIITEKQTGIEIAELLAYIRHAIRNNSPTTIQVNVGQRVSNGVFSFSVNGGEVRDYLPVKTCSIN